MELPEKRFVIAALRSGGSEDFTILWSRSAIRGTLSVKRCLTRSAVSSPRSHFHLMPSINSCKNSFTWLELSPTARKVGSNEPGGVRISRHSKGRLRDYHFLIFFLAMFCTASHLMEGRSSR
jgi:hypothetical protein